MTKKKTAVVSNLFDLVMSKSKKFIDTAKKPLLEKKAKREFKAMIDASLSELVDIKEETLELLTDVRNLDVPTIVANMEEMEEIKSEMEKVAQVYALVFGEELELDIDEIDLDFDLSEILGRVSEVDVDESDED